MPKEAKSKLDQYEGQLLEMDARKVSLAAMQQWLGDEGLKVDQSTISRFLESRRSARLQEELLARITDGSRRCEEVQQAFDQNPAPELGTLIKLFQNLIFQVSTSGADSEALNLADRMTNTVLQFLSAQTKAAFKEREVSLAEAKAAEAKKDEQTKALEYCLEQAKAWPAVEDSFKAAFAALKAAKQAKPAPH